MYQVPAGTTTRPPPACTQAPTAALNDSVHFVPSVFAPQATMETSAADAQQAANAAPDKTVTLSNNLLMSNSIPKTPIRVNPLQLGD